MGATEEGTVNGAGWEGRGECVGARGTPAVPPGAISGTGEETVTGGGVREALFGSFPSLPCHSLWPPGHHPQGSCLPPLAGPTPHMPFHYPSIVSSLFLSSCSLPRNSSPSFPPHFTLTPQASCRHEQAATAIRPFSSPPLPTPSSSNPHIDPTDSSHFVFSSNRFRVLSIF
jgi:hypothetical protein